MKHVIKSKNAPIPIGPYSQGILTNNTLYISGQIPINPDTNLLIKEDIKKQTKQVMTNIGNILSEAGMGFENIVKTSIFIKDMSIFEQVNEAYEKFFNSDFPARETIQVSGLPKNADLEISVIAQIF